MSKQEIIKIFGDRKIRSVWDDEAEIWYFSIVDVVAVLTESVNPANYWKVLNPTFHVRNESPRFARAFVRFLELSNKGLHYTPADAVCAASELTFGGGCAGSVSPSWFKRILTSSFGST